MYIENFVYLEEGEIIIEVFRNLTKYVIRKNTDKYEPKCENLDASRY